MTDIRVSIWAKLKQTFLRQCQWRRQGVGVGRGGTKIGGLGDGSPPVGSRGEVQVQVPFTYDEYEYICAARCEAWRYCRVVGRSAARKTLFVSYNVSLQVISVACNSAAVLHRCRWVWAINNDISWRDAADALHTEAAAASSDDDNNDVLMMLQWLVITGNRACNLDTLLSFAVTSNWTILFVVIIGANGAMAPQECFDRQLIPYRYSSSCWCYSSKNASVDELNFWYDVFISRLCIWVALANREHSQLWTRGWSTGMLHFLSR